MIRSFHGLEAARIWRGERSRKLPHDIQDRALRKLRQLDAVGTLDDLRNPPGNRLEMLKGARAGQMSIRTTTSGVSAFIGLMATQLMLRSWITTEGKREGAS